MLFIALDIGSSYIKSVLFEMDEERVVEKNKVPMLNKLPNIDDNIFEIDGESLFQIIKNIIFDFQYRYKEIKGVVFSTQMHGFVYSCPNSEKEIYISWQDTRCLSKMPGTDKSYIEFMMDEISKEEMKNTGVYFKPALALCNLYTLYNQKNFKSDGGITIYTLGSYLISKLTGNNICHITNAAPLGFANIFTGAWDQDILKRLGLFNINLPKITRSFDSCGDYSVNGTCISIYPDIGDMQTAVLGCSAKDGDMVINIGTAGQIILLDKQPKNGNIETRPFFQNLYCNVISRMPSGRNLDVQVDYLREAGERVFGISIRREDVWKKILNKFSICNTGGLVVDSGFYELPDRLADGAIKHIDRANFTINNVISATLIDIGRIYNNYIRLLCGSRGLKGNLYFCGGVSLNNPILVDTIEKESGLKALIPPIENEIYIGMFRLALLCTKKCKGIEKAIEKELKIV